MRAFVRNKDGSAQQELNQSPLGFQETEASPGKPPLLSDVCRFCTSSRSCSWFASASMPPLCNAETFGPAAHMSARLGSCSACALRLWKLHALCCPLASRCLRTDSCW